MVNIMVRRKYKLVQGVGVNDADYAVHPLIGGKKEMCPFYRVWSNMLKRCYDANQLRKNPTYYGCSVSDEWLIFSNFKAWMEQQDWKWKNLDKDILLDGNKIYSAETCVFVDATVNLFILDRQALRGQWPIGVNFDRATKKFRAKCNDAFLKKIVHLGLFDCPSEAHLAWKRYKSTLAHKIADMQCDKRVADALRSRYS